MRKELSMQKKFCSLLLTTTMIVSSFPPCVGDNITIQPSEKLVEGELTITNDIFLDSFHRDLQERIFKSDITSITENETVIVAEIEEKTEPETETFEEVESTEEPSTQPETEAATEEQTDYVESNSSDIDIQDYELEYLYRIVEAEATGEGFYGKKLVAIVILNRIKSEVFPNTIYDVIFQNNQFSPVMDGRLWSVNVTDETIQAVDQAIADGEEAYGALYFRSTRCDYGSWSNSLSYLFTYGGHAFYK